MNNIDLVLDKEIRLSEKGYNPDILVMTATPIPRTLALILIWWFRYIYNRWVSSRKTTNRNYSRMIKIKEIRAYNSLSKRRSRKRKTSIYSVSFSWRKWKL